MKIYMLVAIALMSSSCVGTGDSKLTVSLEKNNPQDSSNKDGNSSNNTADNSSDNSSNNSSGNDSNNSAGSDSSDSESGSESSSDSGSDSDSSSGSDPTPSNEIFIDFSNTTDLTDHFNVINYSGFSSSQTAIHPYTGSNSLKCTSDANHGSCRQTSKNTFNLPISIELDFAAGATYHTGSSFRIYLYEGTPTRESYYNYITSATNYAGIAWNHTYNSAIGYNGKFIQAGGGFSDTLIPSSASGSFSLSSSSPNVNVGDYGKMLLEVNADGSYTFTFTAYDSSGNYLNEYVYNGNLPVVPANFTIELQQTNYSSGKTFYYDNLKITY